MTDELVDASTELANLNAENDERLKRVLSQGFPLQPGMFESLRILTYLETLLSDRFLLDQANLDFANKASGLLDNIESVMRQSKIVSGGALKPEDIDKIVQIRPHGS